MSSRARRLEGLGWVVCLWIACAAEARAVTICAGDCASTLGPPRAYRVASGELTRVGAPSEGVSGAMRIREVIPAAGEPIGFDLAFEITELEIVSDASAYSASGVLDPNEQGGIGVPRELRLLDVFGGVVSPGSGPLNRVASSYGFDAVRDDLASGVVRWTRVVLSTPTPSGSFWSGDARSHPDRILLDLELREHAWESDGTTLITFDDRLLGRVSLDLVTIPEPGPALLVALGLALLARPTTRRSGS